MRRQGAGPNRRGGCFRVASRLPWNFSPAESAIILPQTAVWISQQGVTVATGVSQWVSYLGGVSSALVQATGGFQPAYNAIGGVGGRPLITFDGVDDVLKGGFLKNPALFADLEMGYIGQRVAYVSVSDVWMMLEETATGAFIYGIRDQSATQWHGTTATQTIVSVGSDPDGVNAHYSWDAAPGAFNLRVGGVVNATSGQPFGSDAGTGRSLAIGGRTAVGTYANIAGQAHYAGALLSAAQRTYLRAALTFYTGINC